VAEIAAKIADFFNNNVVTQLLSRLANW